MNATCQILNRGEALLSNAELDEACHPAHVISDQTNQTKVQRRSCKSGSSC
jgi:hypothetical protein